MAKPHKGSESKRPPIPQSTPHALVSKDAATYLGFSDQTLRAWRRQGRGPVFYRVSPTAVRYRPADLDAWLASMRILPTPTEAA